MRTLLLTAAAFALIAGPTLAQTATPAAPAAAAAPAVPTEAQLQAAGEAFGTEMEAMSSELTAAKTAAGADTAKANADADVIQASYQAKADAFAASFQAFVGANPGMIPAEAVSTIMSQIQGAPAMVRQGVMSPPAAPAAAN